MTSESVVRHSGRKVRSEEGATRSKPARQLERNDFGLVCYFVPRMGSGGWNRTYVHRAVTPKMQQQRSLNTCRASIVLKRNSKSKSSMQIDGCCQVHGAVAVPQSGSHGGGTDDLKGQRLHSLNVRNALLQQDSHITAADIIVASRTYALDTWLAHTAPSTPRIPRESDYTILVRYSFNRVPSLD